MMKAGKKIAIFLFSVLLFMSSCTNDGRSADGEMLPEGKYPLVISSVSIEGESIERPWGAVPKIVENQTDGKSSAWEWNGSEMIGVQMGNETAIYTLNADRTLTSDNQLYWKSTSLADITAWYPIDAVNLSDQSGGLSYVLKADENASYTDIINLYFKHQLAKVRVVLSGTQADLAQSVEVYGITACTNQEGAVSYDADNNGWIKMKEQTYNGAKCWEANVVPGVTIDLTNFIRLNGTTVVNNLMGIPTTLNAATMYTINLTVGDNQIFGGETITKPGKYI